MAGSDGKTHLQWISWIGAGSQREKSGNNKHCLYRKITFVAGVIVRGDGKIISLSLNEAADIYRLINPYIDLIRVGTAFPAEIYVVARNRRVCIRTPLKRNTRIRLRYS